jgi:hypothetical protein
MLNHPMQNVPTANKIYDLPLPSDMQQHLYCVFDVYGASLSTDCNHAVSALLAACNYGGASFNIQPAVPLQHSFALFQPATPKTTISKQLGYDPASSGSGCRRAWKTLCSYISFTEIDISPTRRQQRRWRPGMNL